MRRAVSRFEPLRTAIVSDLHLGSAFGEDLLRDAAIRRVLLEEISSADRLVLLGDVLELRELPLPAVIDAVGPFFAELGEALAGRSVVLVPGNHDHRLAEPLLERHALDEQPLGLEQTAEPAGVVAGKIAGWLGSAELRLAYPGIWLREDVYATHGHYIDCHWRLPRLECVAAASVIRAFGPLPESARPGDYERVLRPVYGLSFSLAQSGVARRASRPSERAWRTLAARDRANGRLRRAALRAAIAAGVPAAIWSVNRALHADFATDLSPASITRSGIVATTELARRLGLEANHVITGHTHRGGPDERDAGWELPGGSLHNSGSWVFASAFHRPGTPPGPYWPGTVTWLEDDGPPRRVRLLLDRSRDELRAVARRLAVHT
jgi:3',5'-cyclic AMP phosphodiesterase CpdA